jgi:hypothetical protein
MDTQNKTNNFSNKSNKTTNEIFSISKMIGNKSKNDSSNAFHELNSSNIRENGLHIFNKKKNQREIANELREDDEDEFGEPLVQIGKRNSETDEEYESIEDQEAEEQEYPFSSNFIEQDATKTVARGESDHLYNDSGDESPKRKYQNNEIDSVQFKRFKKDFNEKGRIYSNNPYCFYKFLI